MLKNWHHQQNCLTGRFGECKKCDHSVMQLYAHTEKCENSACPVVDCLAIRENLQQTFSCLPLCGDIDPQKLSPFQPVNYACSNPQFSTLCTELQHRSSSLTSLDVLQDYTFYSNLQYSTSLSEWQHSFRQRSGSLTSLNVLQDYSLTVRYFKTKAEEIEINNADSSLLGQNQSMPSMMNVYERDGDVTHTSMSFRGESEGQSVFPHQEFLHKFRTVSCYHWISSK